ncbi:MAG: hypothetical protein Q9167_006834 [Letrouitia subvulpina]
MLEPLAILSVANSVVQFIEFGANVVTKAKQIYEEGHNLESRRLGTQSEDIKWVTHDLNAKDLFANTATGYDCASNQQKASQRRNDGTDSHSAARQENGRASRRRGDLVQNIREQIREQKLNQANDALRKRVELRQMDIDNIGFEAKKNRIQAMADDLFALNQGLQYRERPCLD